MKLSNIIKRKTSMVLHQIEESLGDFVLSGGSVEALSPEKIDGIHKREIDKGRNFNRGSIKDVVEATYLDELFGFALDISVDTSAEDSVKYLYSLFHHLDIYEVRNAISHPNKPFWDCYWYRVAAIASDPVNEVLGLKGIKEILVAAESGSITDPPEEWINKIIWQIPNNLPDYFDHGLTGLIGRSKELSELKRYISNSRVNTVALVAPGGAGKTALALDLLHGMVSNPGYAKHVDAVVYVSMKTEKLTTNGVVSLDAAESIDELKLAIRDSINDIFEESWASYDDAVDSKKNLRIILCIDNLETILRDYHDDFENVNYALPSQWKVLVTSRVVISNATIMSLEMLKDKSAVHLARTYLSRRGGADLGADEYSSLAKSCFYNPLAIRLTIDLIVAGRAVPDSVNVANREIAEFSYNNLIDALSTQAIEVLEATFVEGGSSRLSLCELLDRSMDDISSAIGELSKTSLIARGSSDEGEVYSLSDSVRDLLIISPRNIDVRVSVQERIHKRRVLSNEIDIKQADLDVPAWHVNFVPKSINENLKILVNEVNAKISKAGKNVDIAAGLYRKLKESGFMYSKDYLYHKSFGRVLSVLKDYIAAESSFKEAIRINPSDPSSRYLLGRLYHGTKRYSDAALVYDGLVSEGWCGNDSSLFPFGKSVYDGLFLALLYDGKYEDVLDRTKKWKDSGIYRGVLGAYRASAWKRKMENIVDSEPKLAVQCLVKASRILDDIFRNEGYFGTVNRQALKVFDEIEFCFSRTFFYSNFPDECIELLSFVARNIGDVSRGDRNASVEHLIDSLREIAVTGNPFCSGDWGARSLPSDDFDGEAEQGLVAVKVKARPKDKASFMFATDVEGNDYFLHYDAFKGGGWRSWLQISTGDELNVLAEKTGSTSGKARRALEVYKVS